MSKFAVILYGTAAALLWLTFHHTSKDEAQLQELMTSADLATTREQAGGLVSYCQQFRTGVVRELLVRDELPRRCRITSRDSELFLFRQHKEIEIVEELDHVRCILQEELYVTPQGQPMQIVHTLEAERACYDYTTQTLTASDALVRKYRLPGHALGEFPRGAALMSSRAKHVTLTIHGKDYNLNAKGLTLILGET